MFNNIMLCIFLLEGGRDKLGRLFGKGVIEYENGDIVAGMVKVRYVYPHQGFTKVVLSLSCYCMNCLIINSVHKIGRQKKWRI